MKGALEGARATQIDQSKFASKCLVFVVISLHTNAARSVQNDLSRMHIDKTNDGNVLSYKIKTKKKKKNSSHHIVGEFT